MKIAHEFTVSAPIDTAWETLTDLEAVAPLLPGAEMTGRDGDDFLGKVKVKVGPVTSEFAGRAKFVEKDEANHRAIIDARGRESRGSGNASATITAQLYEDVHEDGPRTRVTIDTDMKIVGKLAQFGSGMIQQVSEKLMGQFAASLEEQLTAPAAPVSAIEPAGVDTRAPAPQAPVDLLELAGGWVLKRAVPVVLAALAAVVVYGVLRTLRTRHGRRTRRT